MSTSPPLINKPIAGHDATSWSEFVATLRQRRPAPASTSKSVAGISINFGKRIIIKFLKAEKEVTENELELLAAEYSKPVAELRALLTLRKIKIMNSTGEQTNAKPKRERKTKQPKHPKHERQTHAGDAAQS